MQPKILIVEDMEEARDYLSSILVAHDYRVILADNGRTALEAFHWESCDLVITDIRMPEMDGLTLLRKLKDIAPEVPVIIVSAYLKPEDIMLALRLGACDYLTKPFDDQGLLKSVRRVMHQKRQQQTVERFLGRCLLSESQRYVIENDTEMIEALAQLLSRNLGMVGLLKDLYSIKVALIEALNNAIYHGNLELTSALKNESNQEGLVRYQRLADERRHQAPYRDRRVTVDYQLDRYQVCYTIRDEGSGFDYRRLPDPLNPMNFLQPYGRGLLMIRTFCDEVSWNEKGNEIMLIKRIDRSVAVPQMISLPLKKGEPPV